MRNLLIAAAVAATSLATACSAMHPTNAKSFWLQCGGHEINLDSSRERFSLTFLDKVYQGPATFSPGQIDFEFQWLEAPGGGGLKRAYSIDRKSLKYTNTSLSKYVIGNFSSGWIQKESTDKTSNPESGKCSIMKAPPTAGNQI